MPEVQNHTELKKIPLIALVGAPNSGKTTLYNWLTGSQAKAVNYPGSTVDYMRGELAHHWKSKDAFVLDTPGTYSLFAKTEDEIVTQKILTDSQSLVSPHQVVVVLDGTQLSRHLLLAEQIKLRGLPMVIAITMADLLRAQNIELDLQPLKNHYNCEVILVDGRLGGGVKELIGCFPFQPESKKSVQKEQKHWSPEELQEKTLWAEKLSREVYKKSEGKLPDIWNKTLKIDQLFLHPVGGAISFFVIMTVLFSSIYYLASPIMDQIESLFSIISEITLGLAPESLFIDFLANGIVTSFGAVIIFVPQIFILFLGMGFLESSGYLARAATLIDKPFSKMGLSGRSFVPFLSGYACAVPALMAARNINSARERWIARFIIPLLSCSARLPVYGILLAFIFSQSSAWVPGLVLALIYIGTMLLSALAAGLLNKLIPKDRTSFFLMELPLYRRPVLKVILNHAWMKTKSFITRAGPVIFILTVILWVGTTFPHYKANDMERIQTSYLGKVGQKIEPVFEPMGLDWRAGVGLLAAFAAREVFVSTLAIVYNVTEVNEKKSVTDDGMIATLRDARFPDGRSIFTTASTVGLIIFFMIALQCLSTVGMMIKESGSVKIAMIQLFSFNLFAYLLAVAVVQGLRLVGIA